MDTALRPLIIRRGRKDQLRFAEQEWDATAGWRGFAWIGVSHMPVACSGRSSYEGSSRLRGGIQERRYRMERSMVKAAVMWGFNEPLKIDSLKLKGPREDEVVVKVAASGVC